MATSRWKAGRRVACRRSGAVRAGQQARQSSPSKLLPERVGDARLQPADRAALTPASTTPPSTPRAGPGQPVTRQIDDMFAVLPRPTKIASWSRRRGDVGPRDPNRDRCDASARLATPLNPDDVGLGLGARGRSSSTRGREAPESSSRRSSSGSPGCMAWRRSARIWRSGMRGGCDSGIGAAPAAEERGGRGEFEAPYSAEGRRAAEVGEVEATRRAAPS